MSDMNERMREEAKRLGLGASGKYPEGKASEDDEGELTIAIAAEKGKVIINFGKPVNWLGMPPAQARMLAKSLLAKAETAEAQR